jgi:hypothetical protein
MCVYTVLFEHPVSSGYFNQRSILLFFCFAAVFFVYSAMQKLQRATTVIEVHLKKKILSE